MRTRLKQLVLFLTFFLLCVEVVAAQPSLGGNERVSAKLIFDHLSIEPPSAADTPVGRLGIQLTIEPGWHLYWRNSGEAAIPTKVAWKVPEGWHVGDIEWPAPLLFREKGTITTFGYQNQVLLTAPLYAAQVIPGDNETITIRADISWLVCKDICVPGRATVIENYIFSTSLPLSPSPDFPQFEAVRPLLPLGLSDLATLPALAALRVETLLNRSEVVPGSEAEGVFAIYNLPESFRKATAQQLQFFPYLHRSVIAGAGRLVSASDERAESPLVISVPLKIAAQAEIGKTELRGILVLSGDSLGTESDTSLELALPITITNNAAQATVAPGFETLAPKSASRTPLQFRTISKKAQESKDVEAPKPPAPVTGLLLALGFAFLGGMLLNLMPCVLPIISIKIMGFIGSADQSRRTTVVAALMFGAGVLSTFLVLATTVTSLRTLGYSLGWGFQFQHPPFVLGLTFVVFLLSLSFFDLYTIALPGLQKANRAASKVRGHYAKHFFDGVLATALSTPCTAPFLGTALAFAFAQSAAFTFAIFLAIGLGLALPYIYLATNPRLIAFLPAPGNWMFRVRQLMGFALLGTVVWLLFVLQRLTESGALWSLVVMLLLYFALWLRTALLEGKESSRRNLVVTGFAGIAFIGIVSTLYPTLVAKRGMMPMAEQGRIKWIPFSAKLLEEAPARGETLFIDFTASWCITCKVNEYVVIDTDSVGEAIRRYGITPVKADWTTGDEEVTAALRRFGAEGVPLYVVIPPDGEPIVLSTLPSASALIDAFMKGSRVKAASAT